MTGSDRTRAVIWDMDGVIADTAPFHFKAWQRVFHKRGTSFTEDEFRRNFGQRNDTIIRNTLGDGISSREIAAIAAEKEEDFRKKAKNKVRPLPGAIELIKSLKEHGFSQALGSSAPIENINLVTQELGIEDFFEAIVSGREVKEGKPSPQGFLLAADKLGVRPRGCVVIEDSVAGVIAAKRGGMHCIAVSTTNPKAKLNEADIVVDTLREVTVSDIERLLSQP